METNLKAFRSKSGIVTIVVAKKSHHRVILSFCDVSVLFNHNPKTDVSDHTHYGFIQETNKKRQTKLIYKQLTWERLLPNYARTICHKV